MKIPVELSNNNFMVEYKFTGNTKHRYTGYC